jgi:hypothetical protein
MVNGKAIAQARQDQQISSYQIGGSLSNDAPTYVVRRADSELQAALRQGEFCYIFNARQMGKSSLRVRAKHQLQQFGYRCASIDLSRLGSENLTPVQWYKGMMSELWRSFNLIGTVDLTAWFRTHADMAPVQQLGQFVEDILLAQIPTNLVILIDEIDSILSLNFSMDDFFIWIRSCYNQRAENPDYRRLTFALFGVATPSDLIQDRQRTPFNIGRAIELQGFKFQEIHPLMRGLAGAVDHPEAALKEILHWTGGQPLLTQKLCQIVLERSQNQGLPVSQSVAVAAVESPFLHRLVREALTHHSNVAVQISTLVQTYVIDDWEAQDYPEHLRTILHRILKQEQRFPLLFEQYQQLLETGSLKADGSPEQAELLLSGLAVKQAGTLRLHNPIYQAVFSLDWLHQTREKSPFLAASSYQELQRQQDSDCSCDRPEAAQPTDEPVLQSSQTTGKAEQSITAVICTAFIKHIDQMSRSELEAFAQGITQRSPQAASVIASILTRESPCSS